MRCCASARRGGIRILADRLGRYLPVLICFGTVLVAGAGHASAETRSLKIYHLHTREKAIIAYKRDGHYIPAGLRKLNHILRDWREDKEISMDPRLMDLMWELHRQSGSQDYIHVLGGYRTGKTNAMLRGRSRSSGVAKQSQHMLGKAIDFYLPDVPLAKLRAIGMTFQVGGVGFYPESGSPFVHMDTGFVRAWPRMSRDQLVRLFPNGKTLHLPRDGKPLPGYQAALASYKRRVTDNSIMVAGGRAATKRPGGNLLAALFGTGRDEADADAGEAATSRTVATAPSRNPAVKLASALLPQPSSLPVPHVRPVEVASNASQDPFLQAAADDASLSTASVQRDDTASQTRRFAYLTAFAAPVPHAPSRDIGTQDYPDSVSRPGDEVVIAESTLASPAPRKIAVAEMVPLPGLRPELIAYAETRRPKTVVAQMVPSRSAIEAGDGAVAGRRKLTAGQIIVASLAPTPDGRPISIARPANFPTVDGKAIRGGRVVSAAETDASGSLPLTGEAIARWAANRKAVPHGLRKRHAAAGRVSRISTRVSGSEAGTYRAVDPQRFVAVSVYFPGND